MRFVPSARRAGRVSGRAAAPVDRTGAFAGPEESGLLLRDGVGADRTMKKAARRRLCILFFGSMRPRLS